MAIYECQKCQTEEFVPRRYTYHLGPNARCPQCGSFRPSKLKERDQIDKMHWGPMNFMERLAGGHIFHCCFCRLQFYDRRPLAERAKPSEAGTNPVTTRLKSVS